MICPLARAWGPEATGGGRDRCPSGPSFQVGNTGYVSEAYLIKLAADAGLALAARSEINANPRDPKEHPHGVWPLPPAYAGKDVDRAGFTAIGESDRMTLRFRKP